MKFSFMVTKEDSLSIRKMLKCQFNDHYFHVNYLFIYFYLFIFYVNYFNINA